MKWVSIARIVFNVQVICKKKKYIYFNDIHTVNPLGRISGDRRMTGLLIQMVKMLPVREFSSLFK